MDNFEDFKALVGAWTDAIGTILSALAEARAYMGLDEYNNQLVAIGEGLQAFGTMLVGTSIEETRIVFAGNWIAGTGAAASSVSAYSRQIQGENKENVRKEVLGDSLQSLGMSLAAYGAFASGQKIYGIANSLQSLGTGIEAIAGTYELQEREEARLLALIGASIQTTGSNLFAVSLTKELFIVDKEEV